MICLVLLVSYLYHFDSNNWSAVYKHTVGKDYKFKAGYDSDVRLGWASLWVSFPYSYLKHHIQNVDVSAIIL